MTKYIFDNNNPYWGDDRHYNYFFLLCKMNYFNDCLRCYGFLPRYEVLKELGFDVSVEDLKYGWVLGDGDNFVDFGIGDQMPRKTGRKRKRYVLRLNDIKFD